MSNLDYMGVQRWRLRRPETALEPASNRDEKLAPESPAASEPVVDSGIDKMDWQRLEEFVCQSAQCVSCTQTSPILGEGNIDADWIFLIGAPTLRDIEQQELLTGRSGQLFDGVLAALGLQRKDVYLASVFKCPPASDSNRGAECDKVIHRQISLVQPKIIIAFGELAAQSVIKANEGLDVLRSQPQRCFINKLPIIPTYSLEDVLREPILKADLWQDLKRAIPQLS